MAHIPKATIVNLQRNMGLATSQFLPIISKQQWPHQESSQDCQENPEASQENSFRHIALSILQTNPFKSKIPGPAEMLWVIHCKKKKVQVLMILSVGCR